MAQTLRVPGNFQYCLSVWARSVGRVERDAVAVGATKTLRGLASSSGSGCARGESGSAEHDSVTFGAQLAAGASVDLFGMQVEAQPAPSDYKKTGARGGVYSKARFAADQLTVTAQGTDVYDAVIQIVNTES